MRDSGIFLFEVLVVVWKPAPNTEYYIHMTCMSWLFKLKNDTCASLFIHVLLCLYVLKSPCIMLPPSVIRQIGDFSKGDSFYTSPRFVVVLTDWTARYSTTAGHCQLVRGNKVLSRLKSYFEFCSCLSPKLYDSTFCGSTQPFCRSQWPRSKA